MPRPRKEETQRVVLYLPKGIYTELILLNHNLRSIEGTIGYGKVNGYITNLVRKDLEEIRKRIRESAQSAAETKDAG